MNRALALLSISLLITLSGSAFVPQVADAQMAVHVVADTSSTSLLDLAKNTISAVSNAISSSGITALVSKAYILDPIAWAVSQQMLQAITGSVVGFVTGHGNGIGQPQFVQNLLGHLQNVGDTQALNFIAQIGGQANSPFAPAIASALRTNYLQQSSVAGFLAANQCTLTSASPNINSFLSGNWSQGGIAAWFSLTTQPQNNPFTAYPIANAQLGSLVASAQASQIQTLGWGQGFFSWCGSSGSGTSNAYGSAPATPCTNADGTPGSIQTPGSVISASLNKALGAGVDKLVSAHQLDEIIGQLAAGLISNVLGGASGGLLGISQPSSTGASFIGQYQNETLPTGASLEANATLLAQTAITNVNAYESSWREIASWANIASTTLNALEACSAQTNAAQTALATEVVPVLNNASVANASAETTRALALRVESDSASTDAGAQGALAADSQALSAAPPSATDVANAQLQAEETDSAMAASTSPLIVDDGTTLDQMELIDANGRQLGAACGVSIPPEPQ